MTAGVAMTLAPGVTLPEFEIAAICRRYLVKELALFGSAARGEMRLDSDIDLLVDFLPEARPGLLGLSAMMREFSALFDRHVDLAVKPALKPLIRREVLAGARVIYARDEQRLRRTEAEFLADETLCYAVAQRFTVIGEVVTRLTAEIKRRHSSVPWTDIVGQRNILVHEYFGIYWPLVWQADHAPGLRSE
jgi:uncharacterized protein